jgi:hypothetical protein
MVSVAIFALICSPLLHAFLTAQQTSRRSHFLGDATVAARNIVETIRATGADAFLAEHITDYVRGQGSYTFPIRGERFDLLVTLDATVFEDINNVSVVDYSPMDGIFSQPAGLHENPDILGIADLENLAVIQGIPFVIDNVKRTITIMVEDRGDEVRITASYVYRLGTLVSPTFTHEFYRERICSATVPCNARSCIRCFNKSMYVCYKPFYGVQIADHPEIPDTIIIDNTAGMNLTVFLVKQPTYEDISSGREAGYIAEIKQYEQNTTTDEEKTRVFSNFNIDINSGQLLPSCQLRIYRGGGNYDDFDSISHPDRMNGLLVSRTQKDRMFEITILVFRPGQLEATDGRHLLRMTASQLD